LGEHGVHTSEGFDVLAPKLPIALPLVVIRSHDPSVDGSRPNSKPLAFAIMVNGDPFVQIAHGFAQMTMEAATHPCDGLIG
jgi:hypothetical protein